MDLLIVDDEASMRDFLTIVFEEEGCRVETAATVADARAVLQKREPDLVLCDLMLPDGSGLDLLREIKSQNPSIAVVMITAHTSTKSAVEALKAGAHDYIAKPFDIDELKIIVSKAVERKELEDENLHLRSALEERHTFANIIGKSAKMQEIFGIVQRIARTASTVLISGESGTGKELIARAIHYNSGRRGKFVGINCGAMPETLLESELFGHERGAFTGAHRRKLGRFELAQGGTLFLDEIGALRAELQVKLLRVLQEREMERVGGTRAVKIDVRVIAATNTNLKDAVQREAFREDLYYRLNVVQLVVPPLRERASDIPLLVEHFIRRGERELNKRIDGLSPEALAALQAYRWPGNVRELMNVIERCVVLAEGPVIQLNDLPLDVLLPQQMTKVRAAETLPLNEATDQFERQMVLRVLERVGWNLTEAGRILNVHRNSLRVKLARWGVRAPGTAAR